MGERTDAALISHLKQFPSLEGFLRQPTFGPVKVLSAVKEEATAPRTRRDSRLALLGNRRAEGLGNDGSRAPAIAGQMDAVAARSGHLPRSTLLVHAHSVGNGTKLRNLPGQLVYSQRYYGVSLPGSEVPGWADYLNGIFNSHLTTYFTFLTDGVGRGAG